MRPALTFEQIAVTVIGILTLFMVLFSFHATWATAEAYSSPSIILSANQGDGSRLIFDDFREAYYWLRMNTAEVHLFARALLVFDGIGHIRMLK